MRKRDGCLHPVAGYCFLRGGEVHLICRDIFFERRGLPPRRFAFIKLDGSDEQIDARDVSYHCNPVAHRCNRSRSEEGGLWKL